MKKVVAAGLSRHRTLKLIVIWRVKPKGVQITARRLTYGLRLCRPAVRKGSAFPRRENSNQPLLAGCPDESGQPARRERKWASRAGKAEPFRTAGRQSRTDYNGFPLIWTALG